MIIHVEELKFQAIIGILDFERTAPQDVIINLTIDYSYENDFINYATVVKIVTKTMINGEFLLIEDALNSINLKLAKEFSSINSTDIKITKPSILSDCIVSVSNHYIFKS
ncbi:MAG: dihydroneopterin aldolase [Campylobacterota bacterium]|nr:dihydroneopterin aldolase [Campylobacterota bacterium]